MFIRSSFEEYLNAYYMKSLYNFAEIREAKSLPSIQNNVNNLLRFVDAH